MKNVVFQAGLPKTVVKSFLNDFVEIGVGSVWRFCLVLSCRACLLHVKGFTSTTNFKIMAWNLTQYAEVHLNTSFESEMLVALVSERKIVFKYFLVAKKKNYVQPRLPSSD